jgi:predicted methyltransferase
MFESQHNSKANTVPKRLALRPMFAAALSVMLGCVSAPSIAARVDPALSATLTDSARPANASARDVVRHPLQELTFFGLKSGQTVVELWPGGGYWTDILGPYLSSRGRLYVALPARSDAQEEAGAARWRTRYLGDPAHYGSIVETALGADHFEIAPPGTADLVLTFRNLHNWLGAGYAPEALAACFRALKPGGILGIEEHRARNDRPQDPKARDGYVRQDYTIALAKQAGFKLVASSEMNANPRDTKDWPKGVWTLPPTFALGDQDRARYAAIGEADNYVLKFRKPK